MINATNLRNGTVFQYQDRPYKVIKYEHIKMARGGAVIKVKVQDLLSGVVKYITLTNNEKVQEADIENKNLQFLYSDDLSAYFMDTENYEQVQIPVKLVEDSIKYLVEGKVFQVVFYQKNPISINLPLSMYYKVVKADPAVRGNTANSATKKITLENDLTIDAPQFIKPGDIVKINTATGEYSGRKN